MFTFILTHIPYTLIFVYNRMTNKAIKIIRRAKLEELYKNDEIMYRKELESKGLAFRSEKL